MCSIFLSHHPPITRCLPIARLRSSPRCRTGLGLDKDVTLHLHANMETDSCLAMSLAAIQLTRAYSERERKRIFSG
jgi:hypothetical protein